MDRLRGGSALRTQVDLLLADIAIRVQLTATDYEKAVSRYQAINDWLERDGSPLQGHVVLLYPQGSMAICATIASKLKTDEFDIDIVAELALRLDADPERVLDLLFDAIRGEPGSRYYAMTTRRNRCVTVSYADGMHLDITPSVLMPKLLPKTSIIFHHKRETPHVPGYRLLANPHGFAEWFIANTPLDHVFAEAYAARADSMERGMAMDKAEVVPVPDRQGAHQKSKAVIALQLLKRWRNVRYDNRKTVRRPPSVMIAKLIAVAANGTETLSEEVLHQARHLYEVISEAQARGRAVQVRNPRCDEDIFTDRWPESLAVQQQFLDDLADFIAKMTYLVEGDCDLAEMQAVMADLFGENPTGAVFKSFIEGLGRQIGSGRSVYQPGTSRLDLTKTGAAGAAAARSGTARAHTFYGRPRE
jgi:hypothetical protein